MIETLHIMHENKTKSNVIPFVPRILISVWLNELASTGSTYLNEFSRLQFRELLHKKKEDKKKISSRDSGQNLNYYKWFLLLEQVNFNSI